ncbi:hypothetical protein EXIGLDRAFT_716675 [Exidia glandulosa HHB12029]|uniref:Uncharacterized protein n=1 Tax=Exidia glandulosa HHB12029 TaxID=1314781 RepID=A0A165ISK3_EXIGL|nr:hypothetical protein EXIGLDRAFT_716675 [Exidia glandulosa HHB12029]
MPAEPDLSLPPSVPGVERYQHTPMNLNPSALYTLIDLSDDELQNLQRVCEEECEGDALSDVLLAPQSRFVGSALRDVIEYHLTLGDATYDPVHFIVAVERDWRSRGVLLVTLDDDDCVCKPDSFRIQPSLSGIVLVNIRIGNVSWEEEKEGYAIDGQDDGGDDDDKRQDDHDDEGDDDGDDGGSSPESPSDAPPLGYYIGLYVLESIDAEALVRTLEPGARYKQSEDYVVRLQGVIPSSSDAVDHAASLHPRRCRKNRWLHKSLFLVADCNPPEEHGLVLVHLDSSGKLKTQRVPAAAYEGTQQFFCNIANGVRAWSVDHPLFAVFQYNTAPGREHGFGWNLLDSKASSRAAGDECFFYPPGTIMRKGVKPEHVQWSLEEAVRKFPWVCRTRRFDDNLARNYFVCVDNDAPAKEGVLLVRVDWDCDTSRSDAELLALDFTSTSKTLRVPAKDAFQILSDGIKGDVSTMDPEATAFFKSGEV